MRILGVNYQIFFVKVQQNIGSRKLKHETYFIKNATKNDTN